MRGDARSLVSSPPLFLSHLPCTPILHMNSHSIWGALLRLVNRRLHHKKQGTPKQLKACPLHSVPSLFYSDGLILRTPRFFPNDEISTLRILWTCKILTVEPSPNCRPRALRTPKIIPASEKFGGSHLTPASGPQGKPNQSSPRNFGHSFFEHTLVHVPCSHDLVSLDSLDHDLCGSKCHTKNPLPLQALFQLLRVLS